MKKAILPALFCAILLCSTQAMAARKVRSPYVEKNKWELEHYGTYGFEHGNSRGNYEYESKTTIGYGVTDWWKVEVEGSLQNQPGENTEYTATELVNKFQFWDEGELPFDMGLYTAYEKHRDSSLPDAIEAILIIAKDHGSSKHTANFVFEQAIGSDRPEGQGPEFGIAWSSMWEMEEDWAIGFEYYGEFGEIDDVPSYSQQGHQLGPVVEFEIPGYDAEVKLGYLAGISHDAYDSTLKWELEWEF